MSDLSSTASQSLGIDFGGTSVKIGVCQGPRVLTAADPIPTEAFPGAAAMLDQISQVVSALRETHPNIASVGAGMPGFVDWEKGSLHALTNVEGWEGVNLRDELQSRIGLPAIVENDANAMTYAEWRYGAGRGRHYMLAITLGTGVGGGVVLDGQLYRGPSFGAGEVGQISIDYQGRIGGHGNHGALERYVGNGPFAELAQRRYQEAGVEKTRDQCAPARVAALATQGDEVAIDVWREIAEMLAIGLANVLWVLNVECVVIGGGMSKAGDLLFEPLRAHLEREMDSLYVQQLELIPAQFGNEAGMIGAAALAEEERKG